ncbi:MULTISPECIES: acetyl-CoA C-acetyltransferase [Rhodococcus]|uniref:acetyl-CoA C-acetyltransferase n=1 Tax=Rhodococcus TaxID=1827 RepID=UPI0024B7C756|nr:MULTISPECIES: acetyl-CoA C-acetyltransferase [Rhodococcus]MDI9935737.1 acetyl-CoA C-acetyltransferase [Rhodococcus sp. IEGM 1351]MDV6244482.1 acetyl-CoA C-acetyltransferase [Rhodococcus opacus]
MTDHDPTVLVAGARTPFGRFMGSLSSLSAQELGSHAIGGALESAGVDALAVDHVVMGQVLTAGSGQLPARVAAAAAGIPMTAPALTINRMCLSGIDAITLAHQMISAGDADIVVAGGQESMSTAPHLLTNSRRGHRYGDTVLIDHLAFDGLQDAFTGSSMGALTESRNPEYGITRKAQDEWAARSHRAAARARKDGVFAAEIVPVPIRSGRGESTDVSHDEGIRADTSAADLAGLPPAFAAGGSLTAGNSSPISDGACAVVVTRKSTAVRLGLSWLAEIGSRAVVAGPDSGLHEQPSNAIQAACRREGIAPRDLDLVEINEAFAAVTLVSSERLGLDADRVNVNGGAIALGHPIGVSGARIVLHLALELRRRGGGVGAAALCGGGGQGQALIVHVER